MGKNVAGPALKSGPARLTRRGNLMIDETTKNMQELHAEFAGEVLRLANRTPQPTAHLKARSLAKRKAVFQPVPLTTATQIVTPAIVWDWPTATSGSLNFEQIQLSDMMPQSMTAGDEYATSSDSYSGNYRAFLECIDVDKFPASSILENAKEMIKKPTGSPSSSQCKEGWTMVRKAGIFRWTPIWSLSDTAQHWTSKVKSGVISNAGSFSLNLRQHTNPIVGVRENKRETIKQPDFKKVTISAEAWGQIIISPGAWYNSSLVKLGKPCVKDPDVFFGENGLLRGRVASFLVAYKPQFDFLHPAMDQFENTMKQLEGTKLHALGVPVEVDQDASINPAEPAVKLSNTDESPVIIAVVLE